MEWSPRSEAGRRVGLTGHCVLPGRAATPDGGPGAGVHILSSGWKYPLLGAVRPRDEWLLTLPNGSPEGWGQSHTEEEITG